jgi:uncharacterized protein (TIGR02466 family)
MTEENGPLRAQASNLVSLFPTHLWRSRLDPATSDPFNRRTVAWLRELSGGFPAEPGAKVQTEQNLHRRPELAPLVAFVNEAVSSILDFLQARHDGFVITGCWANVGAPGSPHRRHSHPNNFLSGVYYVTAPPGGNVITFHDPRPQPAIISPPPRELVAANAGKADLKVEAGDLGLFPSWLFQSVPVNRSAEHRISIAFNFMFRHFEDTMSPPRWQGQVPVDA